MTLTEFLLSRIGEDEDFARKAQGSYQHVNGIPHYFDPTPGQFASPMVGMSPRAALAECEAKRGIVEWHKPLPGLGGYAPNCEGCWEDGGEDGAPLYPCRNIRWLAMPYADHPDYRDEWKP